MIQKLETKQALELYQLLEKDFQSDPLPPFNVYQKQIEQGEYEAYYYVQQKQPEAYFITIEKENYIFIVFFAVIKEKRGQGIGTKAIQELQKVAVGKTIILEVEKEVEDNTDQEKEIIQKRIRFYERVGFKKVEPLSYILRGHSYHIMTYADTKITPDRIKAIMPRLYENSLRNPNWLQIQ